MSNQHVPPAITLNSEPVLLPFADVRIGEDHGWVTYNNLNTLTKLVGSTIVTAQTDREFARSDRQYIKERVTYLEEFLLQLLTKMGPALIPKSLAEEVTSSPLEQLPISGPSDQARSIEIDISPAFRLPLPDPIKCAPDITDEVCHLKLQLAQSLVMVSGLKTDLQKASDTIQDLKSRNELLESESTQRINACVKAQNEIGRLTDSETSLKKSNQGLINLSVKLLTTTDRSTTDRSQPRHPLRHRPVRAQKTNQSAFCQHLHYSPAQRLQPDLPPCLPPYQTTYRLQSDPFAKPRLPPLPLGLYPNSTKHNQGHTNLDNLLYPISSSFVKASFPSPSHELQLHEMSLAAGSRSYRRHTSDHLPINCQYRGMTECPCSKTLVNNHRPVESIPSSSATSDLSPLSASIDPFRLAGPGPFSISGTLLNQSKPSHRRRATCRYSKGGTSSSASTATQSFPSSTTGSVSSSVSGSTSPGTALDHLCRVHELGQPDTLPNPPMFTTSCVPCSCYTTISKTTHKHNKLFLPNGTSPSSNPHVAPQAYQYDNPSQVDKWVKDQDPDWFQIGDHPPTDFHFPDT
ncbi:hypothetical protein PSHT_04938 [Puccinia striiformis]|uniref:Uncharacterized protein n=1 Tax=Puccinia striiformis TaxID=27350 RepID=A0A2S4WBN8_9BASI|nr:hypothetical protein PSHT_04938 [Puccinia striiformis]